MNRKLVLAGVVASALALGGTALAGDTGQKGEQKMEPQHKTHAGQTPQKHEAKKTAKAAAPVYNQLLLNAVRLTSLDANQVKQLQTELQSLGLYRGKLDGILGPMTRMALSRYFQTQLTLMTRGRIAEHTLSTFGFDESEIERVRGVDQKHEMERQPTRGYEKKGTHEKKMEESAPKHEQPEQKPEQ